MAYTNNQNSGGLETLTTIDAGDLVIVGDVSDSNRAKAITKTNLKADIFTSPTLTGTPSLPTGTTGVTQSASDNSTKLATTAYADSAFPTTKNGIDTTRAGDAASSTQNIAHGLGRVPKMVRIDAVWFYGGDGSLDSHGVYNGTTNSCVVNCGPGGGSAAVSSSTTYGVLIDATGDGTNVNKAIITCDATNIILTWTKVGTPPSSNAINIMWQVI